MVLKFKIPGKDEPGYLRRQRQALRFQGELLDNPSIDTFDEMVEWLAQYVEEPQDQNEAYEALLDASESDIFRLLEAIGGGENRPK